jgi:hypothetical protein
MNGATSAPGLCANHPLRGLEEFFTCADPFLTQGHSKGISVATSFLCAFALKNWKNRIAGR